MVTTAGSEADVWWQVPSERLQVVAKMDLGSAKDPDFAQAAKSLSERPGCASSSSSSLVLESHPEIKDEGDAP
jgi:hypothetical protein